MPDGLHAHQAGGCVVSEVHPETPDVHGMPTPQDQDGLPALQRFGTPGTIVVGLHKLCRMRYLVNVVHAVRALEEAMGSEPLLWGTGIDWWNGMQVMLEALERLAPTLPDFQPVEGCAFYNADPAKLRWTYERLATRERRYPQRWTCPWDIYEAASSLVSLMRLKHLTRPEQLRTMLTNYFDRFATDFAKGYVPNIEPAPERD